MPPAPYHMEDNPYTLLDKSDLVFIDAMARGSAARQTPRSKKYLGSEGRH